MEQIPPSDMKNFASIGQFAYGPWARRLSNFSQYVTLGGVSIIFLVLIGLMFNGIFPKVPPAFFTLVIGFALIPFLIWFRSVSEAKYSSAFAILATETVTILAIIVCLMFYFSSDYETQRKTYPFHHTIIKIETFANGFSIFTFAFGATALFPNIYAGMKNKQEWNKCMYSAYSLSVITMYFPIAVVGYLTFGTYLGQTQTIFDALGKFSEIPALVIIALVLIILHLLSALPIIFTPVLQMAEEALASKLPESFQRRGERLRNAVIRVLVISLFVLIALFFPYFLDIVSIVTDISVVLSCYILPVLFYWKVCKPRSIVLKILLVLIMIFGIVGSIVGLYLAFGQLIEDVKKNPNPFDGIFRFK